ncbi:hypothetical protein [Anaeromicrobium sediminis]|uniref:Uncharacterized protein n=1 Tax=Anaeromicrobium sediminis TaxID=1478221 RepID=A0A267MHX6_9FIRM|nr:hypothetical protein [Anaeromicrobium sediminis]PAB59181.1 hypothetical protein CCE28_11725 [Anaeromicrobium sediminis]
MAKRKIEVATFTVDKLRVTKFECSDPKQQSDKNVAVLLAMLMDDGYWLTHLIHGNEEHAYKYVMVKSDE